MLTVSKHSVEYVKDPFGILSGKRYEFVLDLEIEEDDELYLEQGVNAKVVYKVDEEKSGILTCDLYERTTDRYISMDLEDEELVALAEFCKNNLPAE
ncbi:MAG: DUF6509 family protein [Candidatus Cohnella colombiensis]|uniref:DUF6509 family protein n=1 Tax=Candidatus Cohnella colombiensis TaxID=3121368 RepID=A0AA95EYS8_9BACL|nr:MAG: DUF6509 family protein [Cohnella sp.]